MTHEEHIAAVRAAPGHDELKGWLHAGLDAAFREYRMELGRLGTFGKFLQREREAKRTWDARRRGLHEAFALRLKELDGEARHGAEG